jgi:uncharacterized protein (DUF924 family)
VVHGLPLDHCEGPDHLQRLDRLISLREKISTDAPCPLRPIYESLVRQVRDVREVIASFARHPHRNAVLGRASTPAEELYIAKGAFPHKKAFQKVLKSCCAHPGGAAPTRFPDLITHAPS